MKKLCACIAISAIAAATAQAGIIATTETNLGGDTPGIIATNFGEDSLAFSDRTHQHNGAAVDEAGNLSTTGTTIIPLPSYLLGHDYIRFANDARENADYEATIGASELTTWYLLIDNRLDGPAGSTGSPNTTDPVLGGTLQWVIDGGWERVNTGIFPNGQADYTGVDEGGESVGPGQGLNQFYSVWTLPTASINVTVSNNGIGGSNMISLVGRPLPFVPTALHVPDSGFEAQDLYPNVFTNNLGPRWLLFPGLGAPSAFVEHIPTFASDGFSHIGMEQGTTVYIDTGIPFQTATTYTLTVGIGNRNASHTLGENDSTYSLHHFIDINDARRVAVASANAFNLASAGAFVDAPPLEFDTSKDPSVVGTGTIGIMLFAGGTGRSHFDNIRLTTSTQAPLVTNGDDSGPGSLRQVVADAAPGSVITFAPGVGFITLTSGEIVINKPIAIHGDPSRLTFIDGNENSRIFRIQGANGPVFLENLELARGAAPAAAAGAILNIGDLTIHRCLLHNNIASCGGAIRNEVGARLTIDSSTIAYNRASFDSGGVENLGGTLVLVDTTISYNTAANNGGGVGNFLPGGTMVATHCSLIENTANESGGGVFLRSDSGSIQIRNTLLAANTIPAGSDNLADPGGTITQNVNNHLTDDPAVASSFGDPNLILGGEVIFARPLRAHRPVTGGPLIDTASSDLGIGLFTDKRGFPRVGNPDIGAIELYENFLHRWRMEKFGPVQVLNPALEATVWGDAADPNGDGIPNLVAFPFLGSLCPLRPEFVEFEGNMHGAFTITIRDDISPVEFVFERSTDNMTWTESGITPHSAFSIGGGVVTFTYRTDNPVTVDRKTYFRARVTNTNP